MFGDGWNVGPGINFASIGRPGIEFGSIGRPEIDQMGAFRGRRGRHLASMEPHGTVGASFSGGRGAHHGSTARMTPK
jgi:hypothetical protein